MKSFEVELRDGIIAAFKEQFDAVIDPEQINFQPTRKEFEGSHTFVLFPFLKQTRKSPEDSGNLIGAYLTTHLPFVLRTNVVKGFLNIELDPIVWVAAFREALGQSDFGQQPMHNRKVMVEFSSPNTNKPLHLGHLRNIFLGDAVSRILAAAGYDVLKTNLINDRGIHICKSMYAYQEFGNKETPESSGIKGDHLVGDYYVKFDQVYKEEVNGLVAGGVDKQQAEKQAPSLMAAQEMLKQWEAKDEATRALWSTMNNWVYQGFDQTYATMGISFDKIYHESETYLLGKDIVEEGLRQNIFFTKADGSVWVDLTEEGLDEKLILRADGTSVYITQDMGTCDYKYRDFPMEKSVYVVGNEQDYHFQVLFTIMKKLGRSYGNGLFHLSYGMVDLPTGKMKSREGTVVDADDIMTEMFQTAEMHTRELGKIEGLSDAEAKGLYQMLGLGALKYFLLKVDPKKRILFNPSESVEFQGNTGPFVQYTHARISAILRRAREMGLSPDLAESIDQLQDRELALIQKILAYPDAILTAAEAYSPAHICQYVYELAREYNGFYQEIPIFNETREGVVVFRVALSEVVARIIRSGMQLLGVDVPERM